MGPFLSRVAGEDNERDIQIQSLTGQQWVRHGHLLLRDDDRIKSGHDEK
jgi:hypothetical protein